MIITSYTHEPVEHTVDPCPFCGGAGLISIGSVCHVWVTCDDCGAEGPYKETEGEAVAAWNQRVKVNP